MAKDLRDYAEKIRAWDCEDINTMYGWLTLTSRIARAMNDDALFTSILDPYTLPVGLSPAPKDRTNVWTWDNHGRYLVGKDWTEENLKIRRFGELHVK